MIRAWWMMAEGGSLLRARHTVPGLCGGCSPHASQLEHGFPGKRTRTAFLPLNRTQPSLTRLFASEWFSRRLIFFRWWISLSWTWTQQRPVSSDWGQCNTKFSPFDFLTSWVLTPKPHGTLHVLWLWEKPLTDVSPLPTASIDPFFCHSKYYNWTTNVWGNERIF